MEKKPDIRVLLLEDNPGDAELIIRSLRRASDSTCHVVRANRLEQALALLSEQSFDVVLADLSLPDAEGLETVERLRAIVPHTAVIVLTGRDDTMLGTEALHSGAQDYIVKGDRSASNLWRAIRYGVERQRMKSSLDE
ncbi:MAG: response regulator, partial [Myxococcota bacterium]